MTDEEIYVQSVHRYYGTHKATLRPGESLEIAKSSDSGVNGNQKCSDFGNSECSIFGIKTTVLLASAVQ